MEAYTSTFGSTHSLTHWSVRIMLLYPMLSLSVPCLFYDIDIFRRILLQRETESSQETRLRRLEVTRPQTQPKEGGHQFFRGKWAGTVVGGFSLYIHFFSVSIFLKFVINRLFTNTTIWKCNIKQGTMGQERVSRGLFFPPTQPFFLALFGVSKTQISANQTFGANSNPKITRERQVWVKRVFLKFLC